MAKQIKSGKPVDDRVYNTKDYDRNLVIDERTKLWPKMSLNIYAKLTGLIKPLCFVWILNMPGVCVRL